MAAAGELISMVYDGLAVSEYFDIKIIYVTMIMTANDCKTCYELVAVPWSYVSSSITFGCWTY